MARHTLSKQAQDAKNDVGAGDQAPIQGGALGVPEAKAPTLPIGPSLAGSARSDPLDHAPGVPPTRFRVVGGPQRQPGRVSVMYEGARSEWPLGKEVTALTHDLALLRRQGIRLEEVKDDEAPADDMSGVPPIPAPQIDETA